MSLDNNQRNRFGNYFLMYLFMCISGNPAFTQLGTISKLSYLLFVFLLLLGSRRWMTDQAGKQVAGWVVLLAFIFVGQYITLHAISVLGSLNFMAKMVAAIFMAAMLRERLPEVYLKTMTFVCVISLVFYSLNLIGISFPALVHISSQGDNIIVYNQQLKGDYVTGLLRNPGMFWEPGAFAGYILAAFMLFIGRLDEMWKKHRGSVLILLIALLTTMSTTGYVVMGVVLVYFSFKVIRNNVVSTFAVALLLVGFVYVYSNTDFMGDKISSQFEYARTQYAYENNYSRFGTMVFDWQYITLHPVFGNGLLGETRFSLHLGSYDFEELQAFGNGFTGIIASMGLLFFVVFLLSMYKNPTLTKRECLMLLLLYILLLNGEQFMNYPLFMLFPFVNYGAIKEVARK